VLSPPFAPRPHPERWIDVALGNTPKRLTNIYLERNKSFALNVRFKLNTDEWYDLTGATVRLTSDKLPRYGSDQVLTLTADLIEPENGWAQFKFQATDTDLDPDEYLYDITLLSVWGYTTPIAKGSIIIGANTDEVNDNVFDVIHPTDEIIATFNSSGDVDIYLDMADGLIGPPGDPGAPGPPVGLFIQPDEPVDPSALPPAVYPLWVDTDADAGPPDPGSGGGPGVAIVAPFPPDVTGLVEGTFWVDEDSNVTPGTGGPGSGDIEGNLVLDDAEVIFKRDGIEAHIGQGYNLPVPTIQGRVTSTGVGFASPVRVFEARTNGFSIPTATQPGDAVTKAYVDSLIASITGLRGIRYWQGSGGVGTWQPRPSLPAGVHCDCYSVLDPLAPAPPASVAGDLWKRAPGAVIA